MNGVATRAPHLFQFGARSQKNSGARRHQRPQAASLFDEAVRQLAFEDELMVSAYRRLPIRSTITMRTMPTMTTPTKAIGSMQRRT
jgi:hypothetical protein